MELNVSVIFTSQRIEEIVRKYTPCKSLAELCTQPGGYRPTIRCTRAVNRKAKPQELTDLSLLADAYDAAQQVRGDSRRAFRG